MSAHCRTPSGRGICSHVHTVLPSTSRLLPTRGVDAGLSTVTAHILLAACGLLPQSYGQAHDTPFTFTNLKPALITIDDSTIHDAFHLYAILVALFAGAVLLLRRRQCGRFEGFSPLCIFALFFLTLADNVCAAGRHRPINTLSNRFEPLSSQAGLGVPQDRHVVLHVPPEDRGRQQHGSSSSRRPAEEYSGSASGSARREKKRRKKPNKNKQKDEQLECPFRAMGFPCDHRREGQFWGYRGIAELHKHLNKDHGLLYCTTCFKQIDSAKQWHEHHGRGCTEHEKLNCGDCRQDRSRSRCNIIKQGFPSDFVSDWRQWSRGCLSWPNHEHMEEWVKFIGGQNQPNTKTRWRQMCFFIFGDVPADMTKYHCPGPPTDSASSPDEQSSSRRDRKKRFISGALPEGVSVYSSGDVADPSQAPTVTGAAQPLHGLTMHENASGQDVSSAFAGINAVGGTFEAPPGVNVPVGGFHLSNDPMAAFQHADRHQSFNAHNTLQSRALDGMSNTDNSEYSNLFSQPSQSQPSYLGTPLTYPSAQPMSGSQSYTGTPYPQNNVWKSQDTHASTMNRFTSQSFQGLLPQTNLIASLKEMLIPQQSAQPLALPDRRDVSRVPTKIPDATLTGYDHPMATDFLGSHLTNINYPATANIVPPEAMAISKDTRQIPVGVNNANIESGSGEQRGPKMMKTTQLLQELKEEVSMVQNLVATTGSDADDQQDFTQLLQKALKYTRAGAQLLGVSRPPSRSTHGQ